MDVADPFPVVSFSWGPARFTGDFKKDFTEVVLYGVRVLPRSKVILAVYPKSTLL